MSANVLVVEDDAPVRRALARRLAREGVRVTEAASTRDAVTVNSAFELGVFDIQLPDGNGIDVAARLLSNRRVAKAVFFTAVCDTRTLDRAATFGRVIQKGNQDPVEQLVRMTLNRQSWPAGPASTAARGRSRAMRVRFLPGTVGSLSVLEVRTAHRDSVLPAIRDLLFELRIQIVRAEARQAPGMLEERFHVVEFDGAPISAQRHLQIQMAVLAQLEATLQTRPRVAEART